MIEFADLLYGKIELPDWLVPFLRVPEFVRLRGVRLSNVDSFQFKDFSGPSRWEHSIAVAFLALRCAEKQRLSERDRVHLALAGLFHDVATPPFAHTMEYILEDFNHEIESQRLLKAILAGDSNPGFPVFASQLPQFRQTCEKLSRQLGFKIDPDEVAKLVVGEGDFGFLINGTIDLDNADNVVRASLHLGIDIDKNVPLGVADWLAEQKTVPLNLKEIRNESVTHWLEYRRKMYETFFDSSDEELGRQAFLQHISRRALSLGFSRTQFIWNTDEGFLNLIETSTQKLNKKQSISPHELVQRYRLLEPAIKIAEIPIEDDETLRILKSPAAVRWIENQLAEPGFEPFVLLNARRYEGNISQKTLFPPALGTILFFKLGLPLKRRQLPTSLSQKILNGAVTHIPARSFTEALRREIPVWVRKKPWLTPTRERKKDIKNNLEGVGDWSFRLSRNENLHAYPSTFVHAIPSSLISTLGLRGELVVDPFGGTGQTAIEAIKAEGRVISSDINSIATLVTKSRVTYLNERQRIRLKSISIEELADQSTGKPPDYDYIEKWHHPATLKELCRIRTFIKNQTDAVFAQFLNATFSAILTSTTGRKGKHHTYFSDNTPLEKGETIPPYENAIAMFLDKLRKNISIIERLYSFIERAGHHPEIELKRAKVLKLDVTQAKAEDFGIEEKSVSAIITSPPYLCMSDYSLGQRLSYYWLFPKNLQDDHAHEIGARRGRTESEVALKTYLADFEKFANLSSNLLRSGGFLAMVLGAPVAKAFVKSNILAKTEAIIKTKGFSLVWAKNRPIYWHRLHNYAYLKEERIAVFVLGK